MLLKLLAFLFVAATVAKAVPLDDPKAEDGVKEYPRFIQFGDDEDVLHTVDLEDDADEDYLEEIENDASNNVYLLFTRRNPDIGQQLIVDNVNSIANSFYDPQKPLMVVVHGWLGNQDNRMNPLITEAYLGREDANVIVLNWEHVAGRNYITAVRGVPIVGRQLGEFLRFLNRAVGAPYATMHLVGFSLGAHLVGSAGRELDGIVTRITGLDPAGPLWLTNSNRLGSSDGVYVEAIHTNGGYDGLGIGTRIAHADFFVNGGRSQPGCLTLICDHSRAWRFFASTVTNDHLVGRECESILQMELNRCRGTELNMGNSDLTKLGSGRFRANTRRTYPY